MPRGREELRQYLKGCLERVERVPLDEPWSQIRFPRVDARKNIENKKKSKRIVITCDELAFSRWHARKEAWMLELGDSPTLFAEALDKCMETFDVRGWSEGRAKEGEDAYEGRSGDEG
jgi:hypothetical protein